MQISDQLGSAETRQLRTRGQGQALGPFVAATASMLGVALISIAYALGRTGNPGGIQLFWVGQLAVYLPIGAVVISAARLRAIHARSLVLLLGVETYMIKWLYSPFQPKFPDELQHLGGLVDVLRENKVGVYNLSIPITQNFPGLQSVSGTFATLTHSSPDVAALILGGVFHVAIVTSVYMLFERVLHTGRAAAVALLIYATNSSFEVFNSYFIYENLALPFALVTAVLAWDLQSRRCVFPTRKLILAYIAFIGALVSHHVTVLYLCGLLAVVFAQVVITKRVRRSVHFDILVAACLVTTAAYFAQFYSAIADYFRPYTVDILKPGEAPTIRPSGPSVQAVAEPLFDRVVTYLGYVGIIVIVLVVAWRFRTSLVRRYLPFGLLAAAFALSLVGGRYLPFGGQIYGRLSSYLYVGVAVLFGLGIRDFLGRRVTRRLALPVFAILICAGLATAVPVYWERLPGHYYVKGFESGIDERNLVATSWVKANLGTNRSFMADGNGSAVVGPLANELIEHSADQLYYLPSFTAASLRFFNDEGVQYVWVDRRFSTAPSPSARYFYGPSNGYYLRPPSSRDLDKFAKNRNFSALYDDGQVRIYAFRSAS